MSMIRLANGVEISEETIVAALEKAGIETKPKPKQHIFEAGDVAKHPTTFPGKWRFIVWFKGELKSFDESGYYMSTGQEKFENEGYEFVGKQKDLLKE